jgi:hypothetical protein
MTRFVHVCALVLGVAGIFGTAVFQGAAITKIPVTAEFRCTANTGATTANPCGTGDRMAGDQHGVHTGIPLGPRTTPRGAYVTDYGTFWFVYPAGSGRSVFFDFTEVVDLPPPVIRNFETTWSSALQPNWLGTPLGVSGGMWGMQLNVPVPGTLKADFRRANNNYLWTVRFNPASYPKSTNVTFTCTTVNLSNQCNGWTIEATADHRAYLEATTTSGKSIKYDEGAYRMPFRIDISYP